MFLLTEDAKLVCDHRLGKIKIEPTQDLVRVNQRRVLVEPDPEGRSISGCPNFGPTIKPCTKTLKLKEGYADFIRVEGKRVCLDSVNGLTDGTLPGTVNYVVAEPGQNLVSLI